VVSVPLIKGNPFCDGKILSLEVKHHMGCSFVSIPNEICNTIFKGITRFPFRLPVMAYCLFYWFKLHGVLLFLQMPKPKVAPQPN
jgi:hypothetical protein